MPYYRTTIQLLICVDEDAEVTSVVNARNFIEDELTKIWQSTEDHTGLVAWTSVPKHPHDMEEVYVDEDRYAPDMDMIPVDELVTIPKAAWEVEVMYSDFKGGSIGQHKALYIVRASNPSMAEDAALTTHAELVPSDEAYVTRSRKIEST